MEQLVQELRAALSWQLAKPAANPAYQVHLEQQRSKNPSFINPLGIQSPEHKHLFENVPFIFIDTNGFPSLV